MVTKALQKQLKGIFNHEILTAAKELELQMSTKLASRILEEQGTMQGDLQLLL